MTAFGFPPLTSVSFGAALAEGSKKLGVKTGKSTRTVHMARRKGSLVTAAIAAALHKTSSAPLILRSNVYQANLDTPIPAVSSMKASFAVLAPAGWLEMLEERVDGDERWGLSFLWSERP